MALQTRQSAYGNGTARAADGESRSGPAAFGGRSERAPRIALYSHDTLGLGHMRRNLLLAQALASSDMKPVTLSLVGKGEAGRFPLPPRGERVVLPALCKRSNGEYASASLGVPLHDVVALRSSLLRAALESFRPDLLIVDNVPRGAQRELDAALAMLRARGDARVVLGLRDVLDDAAVIRRQWSQSRSYDALRDFYDEIWIYGDPVVFDSLHEYWYPEDVLSKIFYTGYFDLCERLRSAPAEELRWVERLGVAERPTVLCLLGGGQDGARLASAFAEIELSGEDHALIVTGPYLPGEARSRLERRAAVDPRFRVLEFVREPMALARDCRAVIAMGGYNTVWEVAALDKPLLVVPRVAPRKEQLIRAECLQAHGILEVLRPAQLSSAALSRWVAAVGAHPRTRVRDLVPLDGLSNLVGRAGDLLKRQPRAVTAA